MTQLDWVTVMYTREHFWSMRAFAHTNQNFKWLSVRANAHVDHHLKIWLVCANACIDQKCF